MEELGRQTVIAHNDPSPARERVLRLYEQRHASINIQVGLPSLDGIKRAVEMKTWGRAAAASVRNSRDSARTTHGGQGTTATTTPKYPVDLPPVWGDVSRR